jgi:hypothetical protein
MWPKLMERTPLRESEGKVGRAVLAIAVFTVAVLIALAVVALIVSVVQRQHRSKP